MPLADRLGKLISPSSVIALKSYSSFLGATAMVALACTCASKSGAFDLTLNFKSTGKS